VAHEEQVWVIVELSVVPKDVLDIDAEGPSDRSDAISRLNGVDGECGLGLRCGFWGGLGGGFGSSLGVRFGLVFLFLGLRLWVDDVDAGRGGQNDGRAQVTGGGALGDDALRSSLSGDKGARHLPQDPRRGQAHRDEGDEEEDSV
jgi:hypothetical protein